MNYSYYKSPVHGNMSIIYLEQEIKKVTVRILLKRVSRRNINPVKTLAFL